MSKSTQYAQHFPERALPAQSVSDAATLVQDEADGFLKVSANGSVFTRVGLVDAIQSPPGTDVVEATSAAAWNEFNGSIKHLKTAGQTLNNTPLVLLTVAMVANQVSVVDVVVVARDAVSGDSASYHVEATIENSAGTALQIGANTAIAVKEDDATWALVIGVTGGSWTVTATGDATNETNWIIESVETTNTF